MFDLFLPFLVGTALGIVPEGHGAQGSGAQETAQTETGMTLLPPLDEGSGDDLSADRAPEPQEPTGQFTTAVEVRPILEMTKGNWVAVRDYDGQDLLYFTHLLSWRCGLWDITYGLNGNPADTVFPMEPCNTDFPQPNAMIDVVNYLPFVTYPAGSIESVTVQIIYDDGTADSVHFNRNEILTP